MKPNSKQIKAFEALGVNVVERDGYTELSYYSKHGADNCVEIPHDEDLTEYLNREYVNFDPLEKAHLWVGPDGHGMKGAPDDPRDIIADYEEWEGKLGELAEAAMENDCVEEAA